MPEMPEVETVRRGLEKNVVGKTIVDIDVRYPNIIEGDVDTFKKQLIGATITSVGRRAKFLIFNFDNELSMISHLRMEGKYQSTDNLDDFDKHVHVVFKFTDDTYLGYRDVRKFGRMKVVKTTELNQNKSLSKLGPEPLSADFNVENVYSRIVKKKKTIKAALLDQNVISGLGNIYVDEVLWTCKIHPETFANSLTKKDVENIINASNEIIDKSIKAGGTTVRSYVDANGHTGDFQFQLNVYGKEGTPCKRCGTEIQKIKVAGRGTHFCPQCQKIKNV